jgi:hypothetical protein
VALKTRRSESGIGVDAYGQQVIDPTKNVEDLVKALEIAIEKLRVADAKRLDDLRLADNRRLDDLRDAEAKRLAELAAQKDRYDRQIFDIQTVQVKTTSDLISAQLSKETASLANQINAATVQNQGLILTLSERIGKLEQARWEVSGRSSVSDPAISDALRELSLGVHSLKTGEGKSGGKAEGIGAVGSLILGAVLVISALFSVAGFVINFSHATH